MKIKAFSLVIVILLWSAGWRVSYAQGTTQTTDFGSANLYLINPAGVIFGLTASLNVQGSFHVSTADYIRFNDPGQIDVNKPRFYADPAKSSILTSFSPDAFGFLNSNPASITVDGPFLSVPPGQTISLVGGNGTFIRDDTGEMVASGVTITGGFLQAPSGRINLVSVASPLISTTSPAEVLLSNYQVTPTNISNTNVGTVSLLGGTFLDVSGDPGGTVLIRGGQLVMDSSIIFSATIDTDSLPAVDINVTGDILLS